MRELGGFRRSILERYLDKRSKANSFSLPETVVDGTERRIIALLSEFGVDHPIGFHFPPPGVDVARRQGTVCMNRYGWIETHVVDGFTIYYSSWMHTLTFRSRKGGYLVIDGLDFTMEDKIGEDWVTIQYRFGKDENDAYGMRNDVKHQIDQGTDEFGHWKFGGVVLYNGATMMVDIENTHPYSGACISWTGKIWSL
jgi:hypothetical protein